MLGTDQQPNQAGGVSVKNIFTAPIKTYLLTVTLRLCFLCSVLSYGSRREQPVSAGGQRVHRGLPDCAGHTQHLHHGIQGINCDSPSRQMTKTRDILRRNHILVGLSSSDAAYFRSWPQPTDEESFPSPSLLPADPSV